MARVLNALVTWDDLALMGLTVKATPPTGLGIANKLELNTYYYVNNVTAPFSAYTNDRCPPYQTISFGATVNWGTNVCNACNAPSGTAVVGGNGSTFCNSTTFYSLSFASWSTGNYALSFGGNAVNISTTFGSTTAVMYGGGCQACPTTSVIWGATTGNTYTCSAGTVYTWGIEWDVNPCSTSYHATWKSNGVVYSYNPAQAYPDTSENWVSNGAAYCTVNCVAYQPQINNNPCSSTYGTTRNYYLGSAAPCNYASAYTTVVGTLYICNVPGGGVNSYTVYQNTNPCFLGDQYYATNGSTYATNPSNSAPSTTQVWVQKPGTSNYCLGVDLYQTQIQTNPCAVNYNGIQDVPIESPSNSCAEVYAIIDCLTSGTGFSIVYPIGTFAVNDRVTSGGVTYRITGTATVASAGSYALTSTGSTGCPEFTQFYDLCTGSTYYMAGTGMSGIGYSSDTGTCLNVTGTTGSPSGTEIYNWYSDPGCECV